MAGMSEETKMARNLAKVLDQNSFNPEYFARMLQAMPIGSQHALFRVFAESVKAWSERFDGDTCVNDDDLNLCAYAKRVSDALDFY